MGGGEPPHLAEKTRLVVSESVPKREPRYVNRPWFHALMCPRFICDAVQLMILIRWANRSGDKNNVRTRRFGNCQRTAPPSTHYWRSPPHIPLFLLLPILLLLLPLSTSTNLVKTMILNFSSQALFVFKRHCGHIYGHYAFWTYWIFLGPHELWQNCYCHFRTLINEIQFAASKYFATFCWTDALVR